MSKSRELTQGEITLAKLIYKDSLDYSDIKIHDHGYIFFQPKNSGMTPKGDIFIKGGANKDYSTATNLSKAFFIHEMAHVWQHQLKVLKPAWAAIKENFRHGFKYDKAYYYTLDEKKDLLDYRIEQQASIIEEYFLFIVLGGQTSNPSLLNDLAEAKANLLYQKVLRKFLKDPCYPSSM